MHKFTRFYFILLIVILQSCSKNDVTITTVNSLPPKANIIDNFSVEQLDNRIVNLIPLTESIARGQVVYSNIFDPKGNTCMSCHVSKDGYDIALFNNLDSIPFMNRVFHRSLRHVSNQDAVHVMNYIKSLTKNGVTPRNSISTVYQPGNDIITENQFAVSIGLGNATYTLSQVNSWDFTILKVPIKMPSWIDTSSINDIMPDSALQLLKLNNITVKTSYTQYLNAPTDENFVRFKRAIFNTLSEGEKHPGEHGYSDFKESYNTMKWLSSAYIQHVIRYKNGQYGPFNINVDGIPSDNEYETVMDPMWFAGDIARRSLENGSVAQQLPERDDIRSTWLYLGWIGNYGKTASFETKYIADALVSKNYQYLTQAVILKSLTNRPNNVQAIFDDIRSAGRYIDPITNNFDKSLDFMLQFVINKIDINYPGTVVRGDDKKWSLEDLTTARGYIEQKAGNNKASLLTKIDQIISTVSGM